jgi:hypothetical protein
MVVEHVMGTLLGQEDSASFRTTCSDDLHSRGVRQLYCRNADSACRAVNENTFGWCGFGELE